MKTEELRIKNWLKYFDTNCFVLGIYKGDKVELGYFKESVGFTRSISDKDLQPIPLTEEILLKCGFISNPYKDRYEMDGIYIECNKLRGYLELWESRTGVEIKYLHQLQNLIYALTKTELKIEL